MWFFEVKTALRQLRRNPVFLVNATLSIGLGVAIFAALFSTLDSILFEPLDVDPQGKIVHITKGRMDGANPRSYFTYSDSLAISEVHQGIETIALVEDGSPSNLVYVAGDTPDLIYGANVSEQFFQLMAIRAIAGRVIDQSDSAADVAVISDKFCSGRFGSPARAIGASLVLNGRPRIVIGVLGRGYVQPSPMGGTVDVWLPIERPEQGNRGPTYRLLARLERNARLETVQASLNREFEGTETAGSRTPERIKLTTLRSAVVDQSRFFLFVLVISGFLVLTITLANTAGMGAIRSIQRQTGSALRAALGATRRQLLKEGAIEGLVLGAASGVIAFPPFTPSCAC